MPCTMVPFGDSVAFVCSRGRGAGRMEYACSGCGATLAKRAKDVPLECPQCGEYTDGCPKCDADMLPVAGQPQHHQCVKCGHIINAADPTHRKVAPIFGQPIPQGLARGSRGNALAAPQGIPGRTMDTMAITPKKPSKAKPPVDWQWHPESGRVPTLSVSQPWAMALAWRRKTIEIRTYGTAYRGWVLLHAPAKWAGQTGQTREDFYQGMEMAIYTAQRLGIPDNLEKYPTGAIVGVAKLVRCGQFSDGERFEALRDQHCTEMEWEPRLRGWQFAHARALTTPIPFRGALGLFPFPSALLPEDVYQLFIDEE